MKRLYNLDYLRGFAAFGIMIYHYFSWTYGEYGSATFLGRLGLYGVSIFYILSGLTLYFVYQNKMQLTIKDILAFFKKRMFRIFPLMWLATIATIILSKQIPNAINLTLNLTGLFGFVRWDKYFAIGAWSIGNELVFYVFFPLLIILSRRSKFVFTITCAIFFAVFLFFAFYVLNPGVTLADQWKNYVHPLNQAFLFLSGFLIGLTLKEIKFHESANLILFLVGIFTFIFFPVSGDTINLVTGTGRLIFTLCCILISISFFKTSVKFPPLISKFFSLLGESSYSLYLLHPLVFFGIRFFYF